jgi:hypothetical protein
MYWWVDGLRDDLRRDFDLAAELGVRNLAVSLPWPEFQPVADRVAVEPMRRLEMLLEEAADYGLFLRIGLLEARTGALIHLPRWTLHPLVLGEREIYTSNGFTRLDPFNLYSDRQMVAAQALLAGEVVGEFRAHPAALEWSLGNGLSSVGAPHDADDYGEWIDRLVGAISAGGRRPPALWTSIGARDIIRNGVFDPAIPGSLGVSVLVRPLWSPAWAHGAGALWPAFLAGYTRSLGARRVAVEIEPRWDLPQMTDVSAQQRAVENVVAVGGAGVLPPPLFDLAEDVTRSAPYVRGARETAFGCLHVDGSPRDVFGYWRDLQLDPPRVAPVPSDFPAPDPERRGRTPEDVAYECFQAFVR